MVLTLEFKQLLFEVHNILSSLFGDMLEFFVGKNILRKKGISPILRRLRQENAETVWDTMSPV